MKELKYEWNSEKNEWLKKERQISFEEIVFHLSQGDLWKIGDNPDQQKYGGQKIYFVVVNDYIYLVPFIERGDDILLITIIPSRKATRAYHQEIEENHETE